MGFMVVGSLANFALAALRPRENASDLAAGCMPARPEPAGAASAAPLNAALIAALAPGGADGKAVLITAGAGAPTAETPVACAPDESASLACGAEGALRLAGGSDDSAVEEAAAAASSAGVRLDEPRADDGRPRARLLAANRSRVADAAPGCGSMPVGRRPVAGGDGWWAAACGASLPVLRWRLARKGDWLTGSGRSVSRLEFISGDDIVCRVSRMRRAVWLARAGLGCGPGDWECCSARSVGTTRRFAGRARADPEPLRAIPLALREDELWFALRQETKRVSTRASAASCLLTRPHGQNTGRHARTATEPLPHHGPWLTWGFGIVSAGAGPNCHRLHPQGTRQGRTTVGRSDWTLDRACYCSIRPCGSGR